MSIFPYFKLEAKSLHMITFTIKKESQSRRCSRTELWFTKSVWKSYLRVKYCASSISEFLSSSLILHDLQIKHDTVLKLRRLMLTKHKLLAHTM